MNPSNGSYVVIAPPEFISIKDVRRRFHSAIDFALESYRKQLSSCMVGFEEVAMNTKKWEKSQPQPKASLIRPIFMELRRNISQIPALWEANEILVKNLCSMEGFLEHIELFHHHQVQDMKDFSSSHCSNAIVLKAETDSTRINTENGDDINKVTTGNGKKEYSYDQIDQILYHLVRDWSSFPSATVGRNSLYRDGLLKAMNEFSPLSMNNGNENGWKGANVLVPGAALGRLVVEIAAKGVRTVEANELSYVMIAAFSGLRIAF